MYTLSSYSELIEKEISKIDFPETPSNLYDPLRYFMKLGGKRMRPILTLMGAELFGENMASALPSAMAIEIFHNFTLIHDDIMDEAPLRRNKATIHKKWNQSIAILSGDVLFVKAFQQLSRQNNEHLPELLNLFTKTAVEVCEGQQMDMDFESRTDVTIPEYIEMIRLKTSVLLGCSLEMGAIIANANKADRENIYNFGQHIGIAFQIQDDILDLYADPEKFGKQIGGDVIANKKTLLTLKANQMANIVEKEILLQLSEEPDLQFKVSKTRDILNLIGAREACEKIMKEHYNLAMNALNVVNIPDESKIPLINLADFLMFREI